MKYSSEINILHLPYFYFPCIFTQTENIEGVGGIGDDGENGFEKHSKKLSLNIGQMGTYAITSMLVYQEIYSSIHHIIAPLRPFRFVFLYSESDC